MKLDGIEEEIELDDSCYLTSEEIEERLKGLREYTNLTDEQVIELAEKRELDCEPYFAEWLVLLDRGDLIHICYNLGY